MLAQIFLKMACADITTPAILPDIFVIQRIITATDVRLAALQPVRRNCVTAPLPPAATTRPTAPAPPAGALPQALFMTMKIL